MSRGAEAQLGGRLAMGCMQHSAYSTFFGVFLIAFWANVICLFAFGVDLPCAKGMFCLVWLAAPPTASIANNPIPLYRFAATPPA